MKLGWFNVDDMLDTAPSTMLTEWMGFHRINPFGEWREDFRAGVIASEIANTHYDLKGRPRFTPQDFIPKFGKTDPPSPKSLKDKILNAFGSLGSNLKIVKKKESSK